MKDLKQKCVQCGQTREDIKRLGYFCATMTHNESGSEVDAEWARHRFKPFSAKELEGQRRDEEECCRQMGDFAKFVEESSL